MNTGATLGAEADDLMIRTRPDWTGTLAGFDASTHNLADRPNRTNEILQLVPPGTEPGPGQIRNSNAYSLSGQLRLMGLEPEYLGIARDEKGELRRLMLDGLQRDVLILTGGV